MSQSNYTASRQPGHQHQSNANNLSHGTKTLPAVPVFDQKENEQENEGNSSAIEAPIQRKLIYYKKREPVELNDFAAVINAFKGAKSPEEVTTSISAEIDTLLKTDKEEGEEDEFSVKLMDHFISTGADGYLNTGSKKELVDSLHEFYAAGLKTFNEAAGKIQKGKSYTDLQKIYDDTEGDDGLSVGKAYNKELACTLFALLAVKGSYLNASTPPELHKIFQSLAMYRDYDEDAKVGLIRMQAGLAYSGTYTGKTVKQMVDSLGGSDQARKFIIDLDGEPHTFALKYDSGWKRYDNGSENGYSVGATIGKYLTSKISVTWE